MRVAVVVLLACVAAPAFSAPRKPSSPTRSQTAQVAPSTSLVAVEQDVLTMVNQRRLAANLPALRIKPLLRDIAARHSQEMSAMNYFSHRSPVSSSATLKERLDLGCCYDQTSGENLFKSDDLPLPKLASETFRSWMNSPEHRANLLCPDFNCMGLGVVQSGHTYYVTQVFTREAVEVCEFKCERKAGGYRVRLVGKVTCGPRDGALLLDGHRVADWTADSAGVFVSEFDVDHEGMLGVGQTTAPRRWNIETQLPIPARSAERVGKS